MQSEKSPKAKRIDLLLVEKGLAESRSKAQAMIMAGIVLADERRVEKSSESFADGVVLRLKGVTAESRYVGRGGLKLERALEAFEIDPKGMVCLDIGSSTGGFTDCLLQHGAAKVVAVDSGTNQLDWRLRNDSRVEVHEQTNARSLTIDDVGEPVDLIVMDVSFISATKIFPVIPQLLKPDGRAIVLIKPQFEVGKGEVGKGGIVREPEKHERVKLEVSRAAESFGLRPISMIDSPILGAEGNKEFLALYSHGNAAKAYDLQPEDFYEEDGLMVLSESFHRKKGYCCGNRCRHCPYDWINVPDQSK